MGRFRELRLLKLQRVELSDGFFAVFPASDTLEVLWVTGTPFTSADVLQLEKWPGLSLVVLGLPQSCLSDDVLPVFAGMPHLQELQLMHTGISAQGAAWLESELPELLFYYSDD